MTTIHQAGTSEVIENCCRMIGNMVQTAYRKCSNRDFQLSMANWLRSVVEVLPNADTVSLAHLMMSMGKVLEGSEKIDAELPQLPADAFLHTINASDLREFCSKPHYPNEHCLLHIDRLMAFLWLKRDMAHQSHPPEACDPTWLSFQGSEDEKLVVTTENSDITERVQLLVGAMTDQFEDLWNGLNVSFEKMETEEENQQ